MNRLTLLYIVPIIALSMLVSGCGIKEKDLQPPPGAENNGYPHTYPDISIDPHPAPPVP